MTINEASNRYHIPIKILKEYEGWGLCSEVKKVMGTWNYDDSDIERLSTIMTLHDIGFSNDEVREYMELLCDGSSTKEKRLALLNAKRKGTLDEIHFKEKQLDRLDYLRFEIQKNFNQQEEAIYITNRGIKENNALTISIVNEAMLSKAGYVGCVSGNNTDKSKIFTYHIAETGAPIIEESPLVMECIVKTAGFESFICRIDAVYAEDAILNSSRKIDYEQLKPVLFEMPTYQYLRTGDVIGDCMKINQKED